MMSKLSALKRVVAVCAAVAVLAGIAGSPSLLAKGKPDKVFVCHITDVGVNRKGNPRFEGHWIEVSERALPSHCAHGDHEQNPPVGTNVTKEDVGSFCKRAAANNQGLFTCEGKRAQDPNWY